jgi:hypothetical protein
MKLFSPWKVAVLAGCFATLLVSVAQAGPRARHQKSKLLEQNEEERTVMVTGSHLPQKVRLKSIGTTTPQNVRIYTQRELQSTGLSTPGEALQALDPSITLSGR